MRLLARFNIAARAVDLNAYTCVNEYGRLRFEEKPEFDLRLDYEGAQALLDSLLLCGLKPSGELATANCLTATQKHLEDMRCIAFNQLSVEKP